jgi:SAM-dependent methyltransferase
MKLDSNRNAEYYKKWDLYSYFKAYSNHPYHLYEYLHSYDEFRLLQNNCTEFMKVLIIGVGFGRELEIILKTLKNPFITIVDISEDFIGNIKNIYNTKNIRFLQQDLNINSNLKLPDNDFDLIVSINTLEYILYEDKFHTILSECSRVLSPKGRFIFRLLNLNYPFAFKLIQDINSRPESKNIYVLRDFSKVKTQLESNFAVVKIDTDDFGFPFGRFYFIYSNYTAYFFYSIGKIVSKILPVRYSRSIYFTLEKLIV